MKNKKVIEKLRLSFSYDDLTILGVFKNNVYIKGRILCDHDDYTFDHNNCVLVIERKLFKKTTDMWLDAKRDYCERYNHFCGVMGGLYPDIFEESEDKIEILNDECELVPVRAFVVNSFEDCIDMEHG